MADNITIPVTGTGTASPIIKTIDTGTGHIQIIEERRAATATITTVADTTTSAQLLAANANRLGFRITNDSSAVLYIKFGTTASNTSYTVTLSTGVYLEENQYTGRVDGVWATDPNDGAARITELTA